MPAARLFHARYRRKSKAALPNLFLLLFVNRRGSPGRVGVQFGWTLSCACGKKGRKKATAVAPMQSARFFPSQFHNLLRHCYARFSRYRRRVILGRVHLRTQRGHSYDFSRAPRIRVSPLSRFGSRRVTHAEYGDVRLLRFCRNI